MLGFSVLAAIRTPCAAMLSAIRSICISERFVNTLSRPTSDVRWTVGISDAVATSMSLSRGMPQRSDKSILASISPLEALVRLIWASLCFTRTLARSPWVAISASTINCTLCSSVSSRAAYCSASAFLYSTLTTCQYASSTEMRVSRCFWLNSTPANECISAAVRWAANNLPPI